MPDAVFDDPRLATVYDALDPDRSDLEVYAEIAREVGARRVLDVGCGTGTFATMLTHAGVEITGVDPAGASLDVARAKPGADRVRWIHGDATTLPAMQVDLATMTANVAQVFGTLADLEATLHGIRAALRPGGWLVFETRDPARRAWEGWTRERTDRRTHVEGVGVIREWEQVTQVREPLVSFRSTNTFEADDLVLISDSTLRFHTREEVEQALAATGFGVEEVRDAPDRPGSELVFLARANQQE
ncbi:MAG: class I SAM-dependent DNA methyltransferase [Ornithinimicrobium sp.]|uniref:class I SAM-dependent DNA methyltransferase n=1 Tax=Ornithinimicrobium sp. TaxID=1977084 RepID=UPI003D9AD212